MAHVSKSGVDFIKNFEGCRLDAYQDSGGLWTIGWGHRPAHKGEVITQLTADALFLQDLAHVATHVENLLDHPVTQGQYDALCSFAFNVGIEAFRMSALRNALIHGNMAEAARQFGEWIKDNHGTILHGLVRRRVAEIVMFLTW